MILMIASYLFNHQITLFINSYPNMWTRNEYKDLLSLMTIDKIDTDLLPLAKIDTSLLESSLQGNDAVTKTIDIESRNLENLREILLRLDNAINNLKIENLEIKGKNLDRENEINETIAEIEEEIKIIEKRKDNIEKKVLPDLNKFKDKKLNNTLARTTANKLKNLTTIITRPKGLNVCDMYDTLFDEVISDKTKDICKKEYHLYLNMWSTLSKKPDELSKTDNTQIISFIFQELAKNEIVSPDIFVEQYAPAKSLFEKVLSKYGRDFIELSPYLGKDGESYFDTNYALKHIYSIMIHVFKHTMSVNFINTIAQLLIRKDVGRSDAITGKNVYNAMESSKFIEYCIKTLPSVMIKSVCKISETDKDPDTSTTPTDALNTALDRLTMSTYDSIDKSTIDIAKDNIVPFFSVYMETYTAEMHRMMVKQCKIFIQINKVMQILMELAKKTKLEMQATKDLY